MFSTYGHTKWKGFENFKIRSDQGGEIENDQFENFCEKYRILQDFSCPITLQQNGVVERKNRFLQEMACTMIHETDMTKYFWQKL